uniref:Uncharacterized protein n=1 Tax=Chlamydomonas leiostraca TaxID=1034604 RepID=A0A7S0RDT8_9CHLO|mmetsp:Transcript_20074/g.50913  ORF Transcript_20074/g.50913 Transcript_20074/m.50913 type:complete len:710 (+) Transcript_20074:95-2224(+)
MQGLALPQGIRPSGSLRSSARRSRIQPQSAVLDAPVASKAVVLPPSLKNNVVVLDAPNPDAPGGVTKVYLLAMSHVSKRSVEQVKELVRAVKPDVVGVELCKDRVGLLVDTSTDTPMNLLWHCRKIMIDGLPSAPEWPTWEQLAPGLRCQLGRPVTQQDIEADVITLLSTGLFRSCRPACATATNSEAPAFLDEAAEGVPAAAAGEEGKEGGSGALRCVPPLGAIKFVVTERSLPPLIEMSVRVDSSLKSLGVPQSKLDDVCAAAIADNSSTRKDGALPALTALLRARQAFKDLFPGMPVVVTFAGVDNGRVEAIVKAERPGAPFVTGFESSAQGGEGWGVEPFRPAKPLTKLSPKMFLTQDSLAALRGVAGKGAEVAAPGAAAAGAPARARITPLTQFKAWSREQIDNCKQFSYEGPAVNDTLGLLMTALFAKGQAAAARKVGLTPGAAWQAAMAAASEVGAQQVVLVDRPTVITERKLSDAVTQAAGWRLGAAGALVLSSFIGFLATDFITETNEIAAFMGVLAAATALVWPLYGPIAQVGKLASMSAEEIEEAVAVKQPISSGDLSQPLKLFGEDALLDWPGALPSIIRDRDTYMAKALAGTATGRAAFCPAYVRDEVNGQTVWRLMMPENGPMASAPAGSGDGEFKPLKGVKSVVGVIGSAHVRGMIREWDACVKSPADVADLLVCEGQKIEEPAAPAPPAPAAK